MYVETINNQVHWFARLVPQSWRWAHHWYATHTGHFWLPCPQCGIEFGGHEMRNVNGKLCTWVSGNGEWMIICPACTKAGHGKDMLAEPF